MKHIVKGELTYMKYLKIENNKVHYLDQDDEWREIDTIDKNTLLYLLDKAIDDEFEMDEYNEDNIGNKAHQIIYKSIHEKFTNLHENKTRFSDESRQLHRDAFEKYSNEDN